MPSFDALPRQRLRAEPEGCQTVLVRGGYFESLVVTLIVLSAVLFLMGWAWNPRLGSLLAA